AFGLTGPWRDRTGFAQTMECITGMAWVTGFPDGPPLLVRGACDPLAGMHAVFATILAVLEHDRSGGGRLVEATMVEAALNAALDAELAAWTAEGDADEMADALTRAGVPAATVIPAREVAHNPQLRHRRLFEVEDHPVTGSHEIPAVPFRFSRIERWANRPAP